MTMQGPMRLVGDIGYLASAALVERIGQARVEALVRTFLELMPPNQIEWVELEDIEWRKNTTPEDELPIFTITNPDGDQVIIWPTRDRGRNILAFELREERPELEGQLDWHNEKEDQQG